MKLDRRLIRTSSRIKYPKVHALNTSNLTEVKTNHSGSKRVNSETSFEFCAFCYLKSLFLCYTDMKTQGRVCSFPLYCNMQSSLTSFIIFRILEKQMVWT